MEFTEKLRDGVEAFTRAFHPRPVVYRTTDFKTNEYRDLVGGEKYEEVEENPMLGFRGASRYVADHDIFRLEVEALAQLRENWDNLNIMLPFLRTPEELSGVRDILKEVSFLFVERFELFGSLTAGDQSIGIDRQCHTAGMAISHVNCEGVGFAHRSGALLEAGGRQTCRDSGYTPGSGGGTECGTPVCRLYRVTKQNPTLRMAASRGVEIDAQQ